LVGLSLHDGLGKDFLSYWVHEDLSDNGLLKDLGDHLLSVLNISSEGISLVDERNVLLLNEGGVLFVDDGLMVLVDVLLVDDGLVVLMDDVLMMLMNNVLLVLNQNVFVMFVDDILMDFLHDSSVLVRLSHSQLFSSQNFSSFIKGFDNHLLVVLNDDGCFVDLLDNGLSSSELLVGVGAEVLLSLDESLSLDEVALPLEKLSILVSGVDGVGSSGAARVLTKRLVVVDLLEGRSLVETSGRSLQVHSGRALHVHSGRALHVHSGGALHESRGALAREVALNDSHFFLDDVSASVQVLASQERLLTSELVASEEVDILLNVVG
jgi:hypothetical protein